MARIEGHLRAMRRMTRDKRDCPDFRHLARDAVMPLHQPLELDPSFAVGMVDFLSCTRPQEFSELLAVETVVLERIPADPALPRRPARIK